MAFIDLPASAESRQAIEYLARAEIVKGTGPDTFSPGLPVTREQMALFLWRTLNWPRLAADDLLDSTLFLVIFNGLAVGGGSAWWRAPRVIATNQHCAITKSTTDGAVSYSIHDFLALGNGGWLRSDRSPGGEPPLHVIWDKRDVRDLAYLEVPKTLWQKYLAARQALGLPREPAYIDPHNSRPLVQGEPVIICGSPLMYEFCVSEGIVAKVQVLRNEAAGIEVPYAMVSASINPGNSGGLCLTGDRKFGGIPSLKPWSLSGGFGPSAGDDLGLILLPEAILDWERVQKWQFDAVGVRL